MIEVGRDFCMSDVTLLLDEGHLELIAQDHVQIILLYLQGRRLHNLHG